jgi:hypothetical protein
MNSGNKSGGELDFIVEVEPPRDGYAKGGIAPSEPESKVKRIAVSRLRSSLAEVAAGFSDMLKDISDVGNYRLSEVTVSAEVSAEGGIHILGTGGKAGSKGAITLKFIAKDP